LKTKDDGKSLGLGYVVFSSEEEAKNAIAEMNDKQLGGKKLSVSPAERRHQEQPANASAYWSYWTGFAGKGKGKGQGKDKGKQFMQQYMAMQSAYMAAYAQMASWQAMGATAGDEKRASTESSQAAAATDECEVPGEYTGILKYKTRYGTKKSYLSCDETYQYYASDIHIDKDVLPQGAKEGSTIKFKLAMRYGQATWESGYMTTPPAKGYPKARTASLA